MASSYERSQSMSYHLTWLDTDINIPTNKRVLKKLKDLDRAIDTFTSQEEFFAYIKKQDDEYPLSSIIFIVSGSLGEKILRDLDIYKCIFGIFIFCKNLERYESLRRDKVRAVCTDGDELVNCIDMFLARYNEKPGFSIMPRGTFISSGSRPISQIPDDEITFRNLKLDGATFIWFNRMYEFMIQLENEDDGQAKEEMMQHSCEMFKGKDRFLERINSYSSQPQTVDKNNAIQHYTENSFVYRLVNTTLRKENVAQVYSCRYIIKLLCRQLRREHRKFVEQYNEKNTKSKSLRVYRGQPLRDEDVQLLRENIDNLISFNGFVSTTKERKVAKVFIDRYREKRLESVLIIIDIDMTEEHRVAFADISHLSKFPEEEEILLSIGCIFRVKSVGFDEELRVPVIQLLLSHNDELCVIKYIEHTYAADIDVDDQSILFGKLLFEMNECESALQYFRRKYNRMPTGNNRLRAACLNNIGVCYNHKSDRDSALKYYQEALRLYEQTNNVQCMGACQHNIASIYNCQEKYEEARKMAESAFSNRNKNKMEQASTLDLLGWISFKSNDFQAAEDYFTDSLTKRLKYWKERNRFHPDIGTSYQNLGTVLERRFNFREAKQNYEKAAEIYRHNFPAENRCVREINECLQRIKNMSSS